MLMTQHQVVPIDETWIHYYTAETKQQTKRWVHLVNLLQRQKFLSAGKVMATIFWDAKNVVLVDFLEIKKTILDDTTVSCWIALTRNLKKYDPI